MDREKVLKKIKKCLALAGSSNPNEAAISLRQARAMMEEFGVGEDELLAIEAHECCAKTMASRRVPAWESQLANLVETAFGVRALFALGAVMRRYGRTVRSRGAWRFVGCGNAPEIAQYTFEVLLRQLRKARKSYIETHLACYGRGEQSRRGDSFATAWLIEVRKRVEEFAQSVRQQRAIEAYIATRYPQLAKLEPLDRNKDIAKRRLSHGEVLDVVAGFSAAKDVTLNHGVGADPQRAALGGIRLLEQGRA